MIHEIAPIAVRPTTRTDAGPGVALEKESDPSGLRHQRGTQGTFFGPEHPGGPALAKFSTAGSLTTNNVVALNLAERVRQTSQRPDLGDYTFNVMSPLVIGDPADMNSPKSQQAWRAFEAMLADAKAHGAEAVSTDVWWGLIEPEDNQFNWSYYDRLADTIERAGLCWVPILSFHQCGGNVGDDANVPIPEFLRAKYAHLSSDGRDSAFFKSEQNNVSAESISVWASRAARVDFEEVMISFQEHFAARANNIAEINISLGPAGELRYPSYNQHDRGSGYPTRGALQSYSALALDNFRSFVIDKYGSLDGVSEAWGISLGSRDEIRPPDDPESFFARGDDKGIQYGRDLFDWYNDSLVEHGRALLTAAVEIFNAPDAPFKGIDLGAKIPGIHWRIASDRAAELAAGLIRSSEAQTDWLSDREGHGYDDMIKLFRDIGHLPNAPKVVMHFTCLEMDDGRGGDEVASRAKSLVRWIVTSARAYGVPVKGENALPVGDAHGWDNIDAAIGKGYQGLTVLRLPLSDADLDQLSRLSGKYP